MRLGRYTLLGRLATGGMAEVLLARLDGDAGFERRVVIKRVLPQYAGDVDFRRLFEREARFASFLSHPNVAQVSDFGVDDAGSAYLVMEYVDGVSLRALLRATGETDVRLVCRVFAQVAEALGAVHGAVDPVSRQPLELVHRDVSPENVLLSRQGAVKLSDFGIARAMNEVSTTRPDVVRGKLRYLAPEQILGQALSQAVDVWALGVSLYEALAGRRPFPEENEGQTVSAIVHDEVTPLVVVRPDVPEALSALVQRCLAKEPGARPADCRELARELETFAPGVTASGVGAWVDRLSPERPALQPLPEAFLPPRVATPQPLELARPPRVQAVEAPSPARKRPRWPLVVALGVLGVGLVALVVHQGRPVHRQVVVTSTPSGATVRLGAQVLGVTPWAGDLPLEAVTLEVRAPGYVPASRALPPEAPPSVEVTLQRAK